MPRVTRGVDYALSTLSAISPRTRSNNVALLLTNTSNALFRNLSGDTLPEGFKNAPQFLLNNPIALQRRYIELKDAPNTIAQGHIFRDAVKTSERDTLEMLVDLFDWLESLEPQQTSEVVSRYEGFQDIVANIVGRLASFLRNSWRRVSRRSG